MLHLLNDTSMDKYEIPFNEHSKFVKNTFLLNVQCYAARNEYYQNRTPVLDDLFQVLAFTSRLSEYIL